MDVMEELSKRSEYDELGIDYELVLNEQGIPVAKIKDEMSTLESVGQGLQRVGAAVVGTGAGVLGATAGLPTDLVGLINGIKDAVSAEDGKKLDAFSKGFSEFSKGGIIPGSEFYKELWDKTVDSLETYSPEMKEDAKAGFSLGEFFDVAGPVGVGVAKAPQIIKGTKKKLEQVGESAQKRLDADKGSVAVSSMGVGEMGKIVDKGLSKLAPTEGKVVNLKAKTDRLNFYSKAEEVTNQLKQNKGTGQQYRQQLLKAGVKPDEIEWLGLDDVLNKGKITKQELQDQINANRIELDEVELSGFSDDYELPRRFNESERTMSAEDAFGPDYLNERADEIFEEGPSRGFVDKNKTDSAMQKAMRIAKEEYDNNPIMKYVDPETGYTITGNDDFGYKIFRSEADSSDFRNDITRNARDPGASPIISSLNEAIIRTREDMMDRGVLGMPGEGTRFGEYTEPGGDNYREFLIRYDNPKVEFDESHFDETNVIAHFRTKDRTTSDGKKVFYIEEIQSDWGQSFRKGNYNIELFNMYADDEIAVPKVLNEFTITRILPSESKFAKPHNYFDWFKKTRSLDEPEVTAQNKELYEFFLYDKGIKNKKGEVATIDEKLKVLSDLGVDATNKVEKAPFITDTDKWTQLTLKRILSKAVDEGYDFVSITPGKAQMDRWNNEGVAKFYDEIVPKNAEKIVKKLDKNAIQKDKQINIPSLYSQAEGEFGTRPKKRFSIELTPQLKEKVKKGMAMFSATPLVVGQENE